MITVLYIDDEPHNLLSFKASFRRDYKIFTAESAQEGRKILEENDIHIILSDQRMPIMTGIEFFESIVNEFPEPIRILITGYTDINAVIDAINRGQVYKYLVKPWQNDELKLYIQNALEIYHLRKENKELAYKLQLANTELDILNKSRL